MLNFSVDFINNMMDVALSEARAALSHEDIPVGAIICDDCGNIVGKGHNTRRLNNLVHGHAEINAINDALSKNAFLPQKNYALFVTMEPCPMCSGAILDSQIKAVYYGAPNVANGSMGTVYNVALHSDIDIFGGFKAVECGKIVKDFFKKVR